MDNRSVVIVDCMYDYPNKEGQCAKEILSLKDQIWESRLRELSSQYDQKFEYVGSFDGLFYRSIEEKFKVEHIPIEKSRFLLSSERITLSFFQTLIARNRIGAKSDLLLSTGSAQTDFLSKSALMSNIKPADVEHAISLIDPLSYNRFVQVNRPTAAIEMISEASTSGMGSLYSAYRKIKNGDFNIALSGGACAMTFPVPFELSHFGVGSDRWIRPFEDMAAGHYFSEGGAAFLLKERQQALEDGDVILAEIKDISSGTMGNAVVNRNAIKKLVTKSIDQAGVDEEADIFLELYGRGNEIDDTAEISCLKNLRKKYNKLRGGFLKENVQYVVGYYGLMGLCRLLEAKKENRTIVGRKIQQPNKFIGIMKEEQWATEISDQQLLSILTYNMYGNSYNLLVKAGDTQ
ncbi:beta-ketoacyl synthase N-terminal-like domain-containing protein [Paenibacillus sp. KN14-4R]|uniref:beta-ketoacyl synthase N-terminal-like domain-containing protein n=1 Tax=Paenibacillus sp. KN14-4R TaxID=3445773 RepID=UPI003FA104AD